MFGTLNCEKIWHEMLQICPPHLSDVSTLPRKIQKSPCPPHLKMASLKLVNCETFSSDWRYVAFFQTLEALKRASGGLSSVAMKRTGCDVWQLSGKQCHSKCSEWPPSALMHASNLISRIVHHAVLKFSPCCNKPLPQASTSPYTRDPPVACPRRSTRATQITGSIKQQ